MNNPIAVLISDIHFTPNTLIEASFSLEKAFLAAQELKIPLFVCGDTLDTKAIIRAECMNALMHIFYKFKNDVESYVLVGNHDLLNEKSKEHSLNFLNPYTTVIYKPTYEVLDKIHAIPYISDPKELQDILNDIPYHDTIIMHQGVQSAHMGHYVQDKTSLPKEAFKNHRVISGHYHRAQDIRCNTGDGPIGLFTYIGNPYTLSFGEAHDGPKGYRILFSDGTADIVPLNLRKHIVHEWRVSQPLVIKDLNPNDLLWLKVSGPDSELDKLNKKEIGQTLLGHSNFKMDLMREQSKKLEQDTTIMTDEDILDALIDLLDDTDNQKAELKTLWREVSSENN